MGNCLKTKLKANVNNDILPILNVLNIPLAPIESGTKYCMFDGNEGCSIEIVGKGKIYSDAQGTIEMQQPVSINGTYETGVYFGNVSDGDKLRINNKYGFKEFKTETTGVIKNGAVIESSGLTSLTTIELGWDVIAMDLDEVSKYAKNLSNIRAYTSPLLKGSIETIVENLISLNRNDGTIKIQGYQLGITLNGQKIFEDYADRGEFFIVTFNGKTAICTWKGKTVASYDGSTWAYS